MVHRSVLVWFLVPSSLQWKRCGMVGSYGGNAVMRGSCAVGGRILEGKRIGGSSSEISSRFNIYQRDLKNII
jgi:hypothetical protein